MSRRRAGLPWAPTSLPQMRQQWCHVLGEGLDHLRQRATAGADGQAAAMVAQAEQDLAGVAGSTLFWVARDMVELATEAAASLPEWSPAAAIPEEFGLLCWAKPAGVFDWPVPGTDQSLRMPVDAMSWGIRSGHVGISCAFRTDRIADQLNPGLSRLPLLSHSVGVWDLEAPVPHRLDGGAVSPLSVLGAAWLLMGQPSISATRQIGGVPSGAAADPAEASPVSIIELRRARAVGDAAQQANSAGRRGYDKRFWVAGHWRQQACGPGRKLRKPLWISPFLKGPEEAPLTTRVYLWRR